MKSGLHTEYISRPHSIVKVERFVAVREHIREQRIVHVAGVGLQKDVVVAFALEKVRVPSRVLRREHPLEPPSV